jgi:Secretion system C-terminal sorting domain
MKRFLLLVFVLTTGLAASAQSLEWVDRQEHFQAGLGQTLRIPIRIKNTSDKVQFFIIKKAQGDVGSNQKAYFCVGDECLDPNVDQFSKRIEPGETISNLYFTVEAGLSTTQNSFRFEVFPKGNPTLGIEHSFSLSVDEKPLKSLVFQSKDITIHDVYPNPVVDQAYIDYRIHNEFIKAKVVIHNILGSPVGNYELPVFETKAKIQADEFTSGVYFYTVYLDNVGVLTRKLVVRK